MSVCEKRKYMINKTTNFFEVLIIKPRLTAFDALIIKPVFEHPHEAFFVNSRSAAVFGTPYHTSFPHIL